MKKKCENLRSIETREKGAARRGEAEFGRENVVDEPVRVTTNCVTQNRHRSASKEGGDFA